MCGINGYLTKQPLTQQQKIDIQESFEKSSKRGRDNFITYTKPIQLETKSPHIQQSFNLSFARLSIHDKTNDGNQPFIFENKHHILYTVANGEIYNYKSLSDAFDIKLKSNSDCEIIPQLFMKFTEDIALQPEEKRNCNLNYSPQINALYRMQALLDCELSFVMIEFVKSIGKYNVYMYTDHCSIRPLFYCYKDDMIVFSSTLQSIPKFVRHSDTIDNKHNILQKKFTIKRIDTGSFVCFKDVFSNNTVKPDTHKYFSTYNITPTIAYKDKYFTNTDSYLDTYNRLLKYTVSVVDNIDCKNVDNKNEVVDSDNKHEVDELSIPPLNRLDIRNNTEDSFSEIYRILNNAVYKRLSTSFGDDAVGCLLSGGIDSSIVASLAQKCLSRHNKKLQTFCIGMSGSKDIYYAKQVAEFIGSKHTSIELTEDQFLEAISDVIECIDSYDITTVRASIGQYLTAKYISTNHPNIRVLLCGDGADEVFFSYLYCNKAPSPTEFHLETCKLLNNIHHYDGRRADRCISNFNIEARYPFLSRELIEYVLSLLPEMRQPYYEEISVKNDSKMNASEYDSKMNASEYDSKMNASEYDSKNSVIECDVYKHKWEKWLLRKTADVYNLLPKSVCWRIKTAFSDGVSSSKKLWYKVLQDHIDSIVSDSEYKTSIEIYTKDNKHLIPKSKESYLYRKIYEKIFGYGDIITKLLPAMWLPNWSDGLYEPSATVLDVFKEN